MGGDLDSAIEASNGAFHLVEDRKTLFPRCDVQFVGSSLDHAILAEHGGGVVVARVEQLARHRVGRTPTVHERLQNVPPHITGLQCSVHEEVTEW